MKTRRLAGLLSILLTILAACGRGEDGPPSVKILSPSAPQVLTPGESLEIESRAHDDRSLSGLALYVNDVQVQTVSVSGEEKSYRAVQNWLPPGAGVYRITLVAYDREGQASAPASVTITVGLTSPPTATPNSDPVATPWPSPSPTQGAPQSCTYDATFVTDVTIPDDTELAPGTEFVKTWRLRNSGTCDWDSGLRFVFIEGERMNGPTTVDVPPTPAGATADLSVSLHAPLEPGTYRGRWRLRTPQGQDFGERPFVQIIVPPPATPTPWIPPTATPGPKPDLDIALVAGKLRLLVGEPLMLEVTVRNHGPGATDHPILVRVVLQADLELTDRLPALAAGEQGVTLLQHTFDAPAALEAFISVDPEGEISEENEDNNTAHVALTVDPVIYTAGIVTAAPGSSFDLDGGITAPDRLDLEWQVVEGSVYLAPRNGAGVARLSGEAHSINYTLVAGLIWETERLPLVDLTEGTLFGFRTSDGRMGYARVEGVLDAARTSAQLSYRVWNWP